MKVRERTSIRTVALDKQLINETWWRNFANALTDDKAANHHDKENQ